MNNKSKSIPQAKVAIITVTYNSASFIEQYLNSVALFLNDSHHQLIIVDNESHDNTVEIIHDFAKSTGLSDQIQVIKLKENIGFGKGCNKGAVFAQSHHPSHLWFLNPDTKIFANSGPALLDLFSQQPMTDFAGSILINEQSVPRPGAFRFPTLINVLLSTMRLGILDTLFKKHTTAIPIQKQPYTADWLTGASFMVKTKCFEKLKGFDPHYFLYFEEVDLFYRAKKANFSVQACPSSQIFHISGASTGINTQNSTPKRQPNYWFESRKYFYKNNFGTLYFALIDSIFLISHGLCKLRFKLQNKENNAPLHIGRDTFRHSVFAQYLGIKPKP